MRHLVHLPYLAVLATILLIPLPGASTEAAVLDFESTPEGDVVDQVPAPASCSGPIGVEGTNPQLGPGTNAARIFDSSDPTGGDPDLGTPNQDFGGPGVGEGGDAGSPFPNDQSLGQVLIIDSDLQGEPDDADVPGASFRFDFSSCGTVTLREIDILDVEFRGEMQATVTLFGPDGTVLDTFLLPDVGNNGLGDQVSLGPTAGVQRMRVDIEGSGAIDNVVFEPESQVDLVVGKTDAPDPVAQGGTLAYEVTVENQGPGTATGVTLVDELPPSVSFVSASPASCTHSGGGTGGTVTCDLGDLDSGESTTVSLQVTAPNQDTTLTNRAEVSATENDANPQNDEARETTTVGLVGPGVDLAVTKADDPDPVQAGALLTYTVTVTNQDPGERATGVEVVDTLPATVAFVSAMPDQGDCQHGGAATGGTVTCDLGGIGPNASVDVILQVRPQETGTEPRDVTNGATASSNEAEADGSDNSADETTTVTAPEADLEITKGDSPDPVRVGQTLTYLLEVTNQGPSAATGVTVVDDLPDSVELLAAIPSEEGDTCGTDGSGNVVCELGGIGTGETETVTLRVLPTSAGAVTNQAQVEADQDEPAGQGGDNSTSEETTVLPSLSDLEITKSASPEPATVGQALTYTLTVTNQGPSDADGVTVEDQLPPSVVLLEATASGEGDTCSAAGSTVTCDLGLVEAGDTETVTLEVRPTMPGELVNLATVSSDESEPAGEGDDNQATETTPVLVGGVLPIPTVSEVGLLLLSLLLGAGGLWMLRRVQG